MIQVDLIQMDDYPADSCAISPMAFLFHTELWYTSVVFMETPMHANSEGFYDITVFVIRNLVVSEILVIGDMTSQLYPQLQPKTIIVASVMVLVEVTEQGGHVRVKIKFPAFSLFMTNFPVFFSTKLTSIIEAFLFCHLSQNTYHRFLLDLILDE